MSAEVGAMSEQLRTIHIAQVIISLGRGGAELVLRRLVEAHKTPKSPVRHSVIVLKDIGVHGQPLLDAGIDVHCLRMRGFWDVPSVLFRLVKSLRQLKPDLVQTWMYHADLLGGWAAHWLGLPVIWGIHSYDLSQGGARSTRLVQKLCAWSSHRVPKRILCVAEASKRIHVALGYDAERMTVIANGFNVDMPEVTAESVQALRHSIGVADHELLVGCVGRFNPAKDHKNFVQAAALVLRQNHDARFVMVGAGLLEGNTSLSEWIRTSSCDPSRLIRLGERSDVPLLLASMDVFCSSSRTEAFPLVVGEAMVMGRALVVTDVGDTAVLVGDTAILVPPRNPKALADGLLRVLALTTAEREEMGRSAQARVCSNFSFAAMMKRFEQVYAEVIPHGFSR
jgi:glycosyltransferase involved in cell wall biosynthesis